MMATPKKCFKLTSGLFGVKPTVYFNHTEAKEFNQMIKTLIENQIWFDVEFISPYEYKKGIENE